MALKDYEYQHPLVRELAWIIGSRPLMNDHGYKDVYQTLDDLWYSTLLEENQEYFASLDENPKPLSDWLNDRPTRFLGKRFESMLEFFFKTNPRFDVLAANVQLRQNNDTYGEIDFVVRDVWHDRVIHLEVACKFYLSAKNSPKWSLWKGPNPSDTLELKMNKLHDQLAITTSAVGREYLQTHRIPTPEPVLLMKGAFHHHISNITVAKHPKFASARYNSGWWCHQREFDQLDNPHLRWAKLEKESWLCPQSLRDSQTIDFQQVKHVVDQHFTKHHRSLLLTGLAQNDGLWTEHSRGFIVKNSWPH